jgi:cephalosporin hydroxylase
VDLSVVVVFWNMRREAARTLHSLTRSYQAGLDDVTTEIIVVDNGSSPGQELATEFVESFGPEFRLIELGDDASPSPVTALNVGAAHATGRNIAFMIDGAHMLSPGVVGQTLRALELYEPAVVSTQPWYVGPGQQPEMSVQGYDTAAEDTLFELIDWPHDGRRLFEIGHPIGSRDWFDPLAESCFIAAPRAVFEQLGAFDEAFDQPGGGYANLDLFERLTAHPDTNVVSLLGEATFHQFHGGTTTSDEAGTRTHELRELADHYEALRGRSFRVQGGRPHSEHGRLVQYLGELPPVAKITRSRRRISDVHARSAATDEHGLPLRRHPIAAELRDVYVDAVWHSANWQHTTWLGRPVDVSVDDLWFVQQLMFDTHPEVVIDIGSTPGHSLFLASTSDLIGSGTVIRVAGTESDPVAHHRLETVTSDDPENDDTLAAVTDLAAGRDGMIVLGGRSNRASTIVDRFRAYRGFVAAGAHAVIENTIVNGNPVWESHGPGPGQAVRAILQQHPDFTPDSAAERIPVSFNAGGYLRRSPAPPAPEK